MHGIGEPIHLLMLTNVHRLGGGNGAEPDKLGVVYTLAGSPGSEPWRGLAHSSATSPVSD